jgi:multiple sugar transport system permease protein
MTGSGKNILTNFEFTMENFERVFDGREFWGVLGVTMFYSRR